MEIIGRQVEIGVAVEATRGTAEVVASKWIKNVVAGIVHRATKVKDNGKFGRFEETPKQRIVQQWYDGSLQGILHADVVGYLLYNLYGAVNTTTVAGNVKSHVFTLDHTGTHPALTMFAKDGSVAQQTFGCGVVKTLEITATMDEYLRMNANIMAKVAAANADTPSYDTEYDFIGRDITIKVADSEAGLAGATAMVAKSVTISWDAGALRDFAFGARTPQNIFNTKMALQVEVTKNFTDTTFRTLFHADTAKYVQITIEGEADIGTGNKPKIVLLLNSAQVTSWDRSGGASDIVTETFTISAGYNETDTQQSELTLQNLTPAYAVGS